MLGHQGFLQPTLPASSNGNGGKDTAYFFLDSVDEAKFRRQADFYAALDKVVAGIGSQTIGRAKIFMSSRISEWQPDTDFHEVLSRFSLSNVDGTSLR